VQHEHATARRALARPHGPAAPACLLPHSTMVGNASILALAEDMARLSDSDLAEQALLLAEAAKHPALAPLVLVRLRLVAATLARRLLELEEATR